MTNIMYICGIVTSILMLCYFIARYTKSSKMFLLSLLSVTLGIASYVIYYSYLNRNADEKLLISMIDDTITTDNHSCILTNSTINSSFTYDEFNIVDTHKSVGYMNESNYQILSQSEHNLLLPNVLTNKINTPPRIVSIVNDS